MNSNPSPRFLPQSTSSSQPHLLSYFHTAMTKVFSEPLKPTTIAHSHSHHKLSFFFAIAAFATLFIIFQTCSLHRPPSPPPLAAAENSDNLGRLRAAVTFLPLKDLRYAHAPLRGHTWFMSSTNDTQAEDGGVQFQRFPSAASLGSLLCLKGGDRHDGAWNAYALAWRDTLPDGAFLVPNLTFVSYNHYDYGNIWHGLSAVMPFAEWCMRNGNSSSSGACEGRSQARWVLYHWGEVRTNMVPWLRHLVAATFGGSEVEIEGFGDGAEVPRCYEEAVVMRHNEGGMWRERRMEAYDIMRCRARAYCRVRKEVFGGIRIGMTVLLRTGARSFRNETAVVEIFERECAKVNACNFVASHSNSQSFCDQVKLMSETDILISPHGAQLTNMFLMDRNSSVMEFFPKGWLKLAGVGQYVYHWMASWSGMRHQGAWRDPDGQCPFPDDNDRRCMSVYKGATIGHNDTFFSEWAARVLREVLTRKNEEATQINSGGSSGEAASADCR